MEYVDGLAIFQPAEVELSELPLLGRDEHACHLRPFERSPDVIRARRAHDDRDSLNVSLLEAGEVLGRIEDERVIEGDVVLALDRNFGDAPAGCAEPAFSHSSYESPGATAMISQFVVSASRQASGVPVRSGKVP